ncbi:MAG: RnfABCDGE type electron transport complex subunit D [Clostridia bacterium]|nr:RnfABCDGE type electron transport complex subunit D [Clostridia bacterium]
MKLNLSPAPHVHSPQTTRALMLNVILALIPCAIAGAVVFGFSAVLLMLISVIAAVAGEAIWQKLTGQKVRVNDLSAAVTGLILGMNLPSRAPWWIAVLGGLFAVVIVKGLFGGLGDNFVNPALAARAFLLVSWPRFMTSWAAPMSAEVDAVSAATPLVAPGNYTLTELFMGNVPGSIGETCKLAILIGFAILLVTKTITWHIPVALTVSTALFCGIFGYNPLTAVLSGGVLYAAVFMATDYVTCPMSAKGQLIYAACAGFLIALIRKFGLYPEGVTFAILLMNAASPLIDRYTKRRVYGYEKEAKA